jgi:hypothetical protein
VTWVHNFAARSATPIHASRPIRSRRAMRGSFRISKATGLPVYHEVNGLGPGGFAWVYGDAVKQQMVKK